MTVVSAKGLLKSLEVWKGAVCLNLKRGNARLFSLMLVVAVDLSIVMAG